MAIQYISNNDELGHAVHRLQQGKEFSIDLEFDKNRYRYGFNLCLVQICIAEDCFLIDPLGQEIEIQRLYPVLENRDIRKIVFSFGEDLRLLHSLGCFPRNIYDISIASSLLNYPQMSLSNMLLELLQIDTGKSSQNSNWFKRPLSDNQIHYAVQDVLYLSKLRDQLEKEATGKGVSHWIEEENTLLDELDFTDLDDKSIVKPKDKKMFTESEWFIFKRLLNFREKLAEKIQKPSYMVIKKEYLIDLAKDAETLSSWKNNSMIYRGIQTNEIKSTLRELLETSKLDADRNELSRSEPAEKPLERDVYIALQKKKKEAEGLKNRFFIPVKECIKKDYGEEAASFILSNRIISEIIEGDNDQLADYKRNLIHSYAEELKLDKRVLNTILGEPTPL